MKRHTEAKRQAGFGAFVEIPSCIYAVGTLLGVLDYYQDVIYYVLPQGADDVGPNYVRCRRWRPAERLYIPGPLSPWNEAERAGTYLPVEQVERVIHFSRGMVHQARYDALQVNQNDRTAAGDRVRLFGAYLGRLERLCSRYRYWNLDLTRFVELLPAGELHDRMEAVVTAGEFTLLSAELEAIKTTDPEPPELRQGD